MSPQVEVGLFGELLVIEAIFREKLDVAGWRGGLSEEHDFGFADLDFEVKTTSQEQRHHWVHGLQQMVPTGETPLWLLSMQITRAGSDQGRTLPNLVETVRAAAPNESSRAYLNTVLAAAGWHDGEADLFPTGWRQRSRAIALKVNDSFPAITAAHLTRGGVTQSDIRQVSYEIDITNRVTSDNSPASLLGILKNLEIASG